MKQVTEIVFFSVWFSFLFLVFCRYVRIRTKILFSWTNLVGENEDKEVQFTWAKVTFVRCDWWISIHFVDHSVAFCFSRSVGCSRNYD